MEPRDRYLQIYRQQAMMSGGGLSLGGYSVGGKKKTISKKKKSKGGALDQHGAWYENTPYGQRDIFGRKCNKIKGCKTYERELGQQDCAPIGVDFEGNPIYEDEGGYNLGGASKGIRHCVERAQNPDGSIVCAKFKKGPKPKDYDFSKLPLTKRKGPKPKSKGARVCDEYYLVSPNKGVKRCSKFKTVGDSNENPWVSFLRLYSEANEIKYGEALQRSRKGSPYRKHLKAEYKRYMGKDI